MDELANSLLVDRVFAKYDTDASGKIDKDELRNLAEELGDPFASEEELNEALKELDQDKSGRIEKDEFREWWISRRVNAASSATAKKLASLVSRGTAKFYVDIHIAAWRGDVEEVKRFMELDKYCVGAQDNTPFGVRNRKQRSETPTPTSRVCYWKLLLRTSILSVISLILCHKFRKAIFLYTMRHIKDTWRFASYW